MENFDMDEDEIRLLQIKKYIKENQSQPEKLEMDVISRYSLPFTGMVDLHLGYHIFNPCYFAD
jgi:hypothetical protein